MVKDLADGATSRLAGLDLHPADLVTMLRSLSHHEAAEELSRMPAARAVQMLDQPEFEDASKVLALLSSHLAVELVALMSDDRAADVLSAMGARGQALLARLAPDVRRLVADLMAWPEDSAGGMMTARLFAISSHATAAQALARARSIKGASEFVYSILLVNAEGQLTGSVALNHLVTASPETTLAHLAQHPPIAVSPLTDREQVVDLFRRHDLLGLPVIDDAGRPIGIVTVDDVLDALVTEDTEDVQKFGGLSAFEGSYLDTGFSLMFRKRAGWLCVLFLSEMLTASVMQYFEGELEKAIVLSLFIPLIMSSGGNSGSQATSLIIRALALGQVRLRDWWRVALRELPTGLALGSLLGAIGMTRILLWQYLGLYDYGEQWHLVGGTIAVALIAIVTFGSVSGSMLPFLLQRIGLDPATASAPFVATLVDVVGLIIYFTVAIMMLSGTVL